MNKCLRLLRLATLVVTLVLAACDGQAAPTVAPPTQPAATAVGALPVFSKPSDITNPYFPVSSVGQSISLGTEGGESVREEVTLLPNVKIPVYSVPVVTAAMGSRLTL